MILPEKHIGGNLIHTLAFGNIYFLEGNAHLEAPFNQIKCRFMQRKKGFSFEYRGLVGVTDIKDAIYETPDIASLPSLSFLLPPV